MPFRTLGLAAAALLAVSTVSPPAMAAPGDAVIMWSTELLDRNAVTPGNALGRPNGQFAGISDFHDLWLRGFTRKLNYRGLAKALGVSDADLARADIIAFEANGGSPASGGGWESSLWFFTDLSRAYAETFDETVGLGTIAAGRRARFMTGDMLGAEYGAYFGVSVPPAEHFSWILIDVPNDIDVHSPNFSVWVSGADVHPGAGGDEGTPDPEAVGVLSPL